MRALVLGVVVAVASLLGCVERESARGPSDKVLLEQIKLKKRPTPQHPLDIRFENKIRLIGYDIEHTPVTPDHPFRVSWYWQVDHPLWEGWEVFTHVADGRESNRLNLDANRMIRRVYPVPEWKAGDFLKDTQEVTLPRDWAGDTAIFYVGFYSGPHRLHVTVGPNDGDNRAEALRVPISKGTPPERPVPQLTAHRLAGKLKLDGKLDEPDWQAADSTGAMVNPMTGEPGGFSARAQVAYDERNLYVGFTVQDDYLKSSFEKQDDHLWEQDTIEVMVDPDGDGKNYFEIQVSPRNLSFDTRYDAPRSPLPFGHLDWSSQIASKVTLIGTLNDDKPDTGYIVEAAIPWSAFAAGATPAAVPMAKATWRMNFFVMDARAQGERAVAWSPPMVGDFHTLARFGRVTFPQDAIAAPVPTPPAAPGRSKAH